MYARNAYRYLVYFSAIGQEEWEKCCRNVEAVEKFYWAADIAVDEEMEKLVIQINDSSDEEGPYRSDDDDDDRSDETVSMVCLMSVSSHQANENRVCCFVIL